MQELNHGSLRITHNNGLHTPRYILMATAVSPSGEQLRTYDLKRINAFEINVPVPTNRY